MAAQRLDDLRSSNMSAYERRGYKSQPAAESSAFSNDRDIAESLRSVSGAPPNECDWSHDALIVIKEMWALNEGWDSYGSPRITTVALDYAGNLVEHMQGLPRPFVAPTSEGGVMFEWHRSNINLVVEVT